MTDHDCLWWTCRTTGVDKRTAITWLLFVLSVLNCILNVLRIILCNSYLDKLLPSENFALHLCWEILWDRVFPDNEILNFWYFINNFRIFLQLVAIFQNHNLAFRMVGNVLTCFGAIRRVNTDWKVMSKDSPTKCSGPLMRVEANNIHSGIICDPQSN